MLKLYVACMGWEGSAVALAHSREEAISMIEKEHPRFSQEHHDTLSEFDIKPGYVTGDTGDA